MKDHRGTTGAASPHGAHVSRQWEAELLVSGIAVFAMLQLAGRLDDAIFSLRPRFDANWKTLLLLLYVYGKGAAMLLGATFALHLLMRARWIALAGLHSIYPQGVDWSRIRVGAIAREEEQARMGRIEDAVERAGQRATIVFAMGVMLASILVVLFILVAVLLGLPMLLLGRVGIAVDPGLVMLLAMLAMVPFFLAHAIDQKRGAGLERGGRMQRAIRGTYAFFRRLGISPASNPGLALVNSHLGQERMVATTIAIILLSTLGVIGAFLLMRSDTPLGSYARFPGEVPAGMSAASAYYDDQRDPARDDATPFIPSAVVAGAYLRVVVPFDPDRDAPAMARQCPSAVDAPGDDEDAGLARLECIGALRSLTIDDTAVPAAYQTTTDARTGRPAVLAMLDVRDLAPGRHVLRVARPPRQDPDGRPRGDDGDGAVSIPFWR